MSALADLGYQLNERIALVGEVGVLPRAPFEEASEIAPPTAGALQARRVNAYYWNGTPEGAPVRDRAAQSVPHGRYRRLHR